MSEQELVPFGTGHVVVVAFFQVFQNFRDLNILRGIVVVSHTDELDVHVVEVDTGYYSKLRAGSIDAQVVDVMYASL